MFANTELLRYLFSGGGCIHGGNRYEEPLIVIQADKWLQE
jgi:hypothetical protein